MRNLTHATGVFCFGSAFAIERCTPSQTHTFATTTALPSARIALTTVFTSPAPDRSRPRWPRVTSFFFHGVDLQGEFTDLGEQVLAFGVEACLQIARHGPEALSADLEKLLDPALYLDLVTA